MKKLTFFNVILLILVWSACASGTYALPGDRVVNLSAVGVVGGIYALPGDRVVNWSNAGVVGGIPNRTTVYTTLSPSGSDDTAAINHALASCPSGDVVKLSSGAFKVSGTISIPSNVTLRGSGPQKTILNATGLGAVISFPGSTPSWQLLYNSPQAISGGCTKGSSTITLSAAPLPAWSVGGLLWLTELNDQSLPVTAAGGSGLCSWCGDGLGDKYDLGQVVRITAISGNTITMDPPMNTTYRASLAPVAISVAGTDAASIQPVHDAGVEDLQVYDNNTGRNPNFAMTGAFNCWITDVESNFADGDHVEVDYSTHCSIVDSYFHDAFLHTSGATDADIALRNYSTMILVQNNVLERLHSGVIVEWGASANVIGYNFMDGFFDTGALNGVQAGISMHGAHPEYNLFEGNVLAMANDDSIWGSSSDETFFRNWLIGTTLVCSPVDNSRANVVCSPVTTGYWSAGSTAMWEWQASRPMEWNYLATSNNSVGNVIGSTRLLDLLPMTDMIVWAQNVSRDYQNTAYGYSFGYGGSGDTGTFPGDNAEPYETGIIQGDYNYADSSLHWAAGGYADPDSNDHTLSPSLYLTAKPAWFGATPFPVIGPDVTGGQDASGHVNTIPAQACYNKGEMPGCLNADVSSRIGWTTTGFLYSRFSKTFTGNLTIVNNGPALTGTINLVLNNLPAGVSLANATGLYNGSPMITASTNGLASGGSRTGSLVFNDPAMTKIPCTLQTLQQ